ncbi:phosphoribosylamine--glycine ligase [Spirochaetia bacterium]|nr:phosphoribosylamine--glycine ligase [Spirochaetia bacterium]
MNVLVIGSGGREHAIAWKLAHEKNIDTVYIAPGNGGTGGEPKCENVPLPGDPASPEGQRALVEFAQTIQAAVTVVGPEAPLAGGIVDRFREAGIPITGPDKAAARLESSKAFAKSFMEQYGVRAGQSRSFTEYEAALRYAEQHFRENGPVSARIPAPPLNSGPLVVKADGLAAGKGVVIADTLTEAEAALQTFMKDAALGEAGKSVVLEEFLAGREVSVLAAVSVRPGKPGTILPFVSARDHKRRFDGGIGPNTGGMGAIAPVPDFSPAAEQDFITHILKPTLCGMEQERMDYRGFIFFGLMIREEHCFLLEYNARLGDPETQAVLPLMESDFGGLCLAIQENRLDAFPLAWKPGAVCAPVAVARGYPGPYPKGAPITVNRDKLTQSGAVIFAAGAVSSGDAANAPPLLTAGGRVLSVSAWGAGAAEARKRAYEGLEAVSFEGMAYRSDIGTENPLPIPPK